MMLTTIDLLADLVARGAENRLEQPPQGSRRAC